MNRFIKRYSLWIFYAAFFIIAVLTRSDLSTFNSQSPYFISKMIVWLIYLSFLIYSIYCTYKENFFKSVKRINSYLWGRQIGIDLYIGLFLPLVIIYFHGGIAMLFLWTIPVLIFANLATLLYLVLNFDSLVAQFLI